MEIIIAILATALGIACIYAFLWILQIMFDIIRGTAGWIRAGNRIYDELEEQKKEERQKEIEERKKIKRVVSFSGDELWW